MYCWIDNGFLPKLDFYLFDIWFKLHCRLFEDICPKMLWVNCSAALMLACNCSITHTNVHSVPLSKQKHCISLFFPIVDLIVTAWASQPIEWGLSDAGNRENNVIFISGDSSAPHYHRTVMNGSFCPHNHERTCHLSVSPNWLFTTFQHRQTDTFFIVLSLSFSLTPKYKSLG